MSTRDYNTVATCVRVQTFETPGQNADIATARNIALALALEFELDNPRFRRDLFMTECGFIDW